MFSGIVTETGVVESLAAKGGTTTFRVRAAKTAGDLAVGDSVAIRGAVPLETFRSAIDSVLVLRGHDPP